VAWLSTKEGGAADATLENKKAAVTIDITMGAVLIILPLSLSDLKSCTELFVPLCFCGGTTKHEPLLRAMEQHSKVSVCLRRFILFACTYTKSYGTWIAANSLKILIEFGDDEHSCIEE
jgi:hypothetical protein